MSQLPIRHSASWAIASEHIRARGTIALEKVKKNEILFKLFWYKIFVHWKLTLLNFLIDFILLFYPLNTNVTQYLFSLKSKGQIGFCVP